MPVASGLVGHDPAVRIRQSAAGLSAARLTGGTSVPLPAAPYVHLYVARGSVLAEGAGELGTGDALRVTGADGQRVTAVGAAEVLVWEMHSAATR